MSITISEAIKLDSLRNFRLIAGERGIDKEIDKIGILDYEIIENIEGQFGKGDFVLTSFTAARNDVDLLFKSIESLINNGVSGLAIKNIYYKELPNEIVELANEKSFPIFIFDNSVFFEDIITDIMDAIKEKDNYELLETKVNKIIKNKINKVMVRELALEMNSSLKENFIVAYCKEKKHINNENIIRLLERYKRSKKKSIYHSVFNLNPASNVAGLEKM